MLKRARRLAAHAVKMKPTAHPHRPKSDKPQMNARMPGAMPKDTTSASESSCRPKGLAVFVRRAMLPSSESSRNATPMNGAAVSTSPRLA